MPVLSRWWTHQVGALRGKRGFPAPRPAIAACVAMLVSWSGSLPAPEGPPAVLPAAVGEHLYDRVFETPHPYPGTSSGKLDAVWSEKIAVEGAAYLVLEFSRLELASGDRLEIRDEAGRLVDSYEKLGFRDKGGDFITRMIPGGVARLDLFSRQAGPGAYGYRIERVSRGLVALDREIPSPGPEAVCGVDDQRDAACFAAGHPQVVEAGRAVARVLMDGVSLCTAWVVSCESHILTANHCTWSGSSLDTQAEVDRMEFQFLYRDSACGAADGVVQHSFLGGTWLENSVNLDYALIQAPAGEDPAADFGWVALDAAAPAVDDLIAIVGHPGGRPQEISLYSTDPSDQDNPDGLCEIYSLSEPPCVGGTTPEIGYFCDTAGGGSGSPVLSLQTHRVLALHHCPDCPNRGVPAPAIWVANQAGSHPLPACARFAAAGTVALDSELYGCADTVTVTVVDSSLLGAGAAAAELLSSRETVPEPLLLTEIPAGSGSFTGVMATTALAPAADGLLSVAHGGTVTARYLDADDGAGGVNIWRQATASVACSGPVISAVRVQDVRGTAATVAWQTDAPASGEVLYSDAPPAWSAAGDGGLATLHAVPLAGLQECANYAYWVRSEDAAGNVSVADQGGAWYGFSTLSQAGLAIAAVDTPRPILDRASTFSIIHVTEEDPVIGLQVRVDIDHTYDGDVEIYLRGPDGVEIDLSSDNGGAGDDYAGTLFDDAAAISVRLGAAPFAGSYRPEQALAAFVGKPAAGDWILRVYDDGVGDTGTLQGWSLHLTLPPRPCGPHAAAIRPAEAVDDCAAGGPGDDDGLWDPGEVLTLPLMLENDGTDSLTGVQAVISSLTPGATVLSGSALYAALPPGGVAAPEPAFQVHLADSAACGQQPALRVDIGSDQGAWSETLTLTAGKVLPTAGSVLDQDFDSLGIPPDWTVVDGGQSAATWYADSPVDPLGCVGAAPAAPIGGMWATVDSDCAGEVSMDESLVTPVLDLSAAAGVTLEFDHWLNHDAGEIADVDVRSSLTGGAWVNAARWTADTANGQHESLDISAQAAGAADAQVRWRYHDANFAWFWYVDNVRVRFTSPGGCLATVCPTGSPPGEQAGLAFGPAQVASWNEDPGATAGYRLYRGEHADLAGLGGSQQESCLRFSGAGPQDHSVDLASDEPVPGQVLWYLVTGVNQVGEGTAGAGTGLPRIVNAGGDCGL